MRERQQRGRRARGSGTTGAADRRRGESASGRSWFGLTLLSLTLPGLTLLLAAPARAQPAPPAAESPPPDDAAIAAGLMISPTAAARQRRAACVQARSQGEIVVCGADRGEAWRVPSTTESDPDSRQGRDTGVPAAPNVSSLPDCKIVKCHGFGRVPPPVYVVDFSKLPPAPAGSDADRIAKGEIPAP